MVDPSETDVSSSGELGIADSRMARALYALLELSKAMSSELDLGALLATIVEEASSVVEAERTSIFVYDQARDRLWSRVAQGMGERTIELAVGSGVAGDVARTLRLSNIPDPYSDPRFDPAWDRESGFRTRSILSAPVLDSGGRLLGVIQSINKTRNGGFDAQDEALMLALASHVAVALERAQLTRLYVENERYEKALELAHQIQLRMLPSGTVQTAPGSGFEIHAHMNPARQVGGDLYDFFWDDDRLYFCVGDVAGKGVGAALVMAVTKTLCRANASLQNDAARLFSSVNERLHEDTDATMFVTAFCGFLDLRDGRLQYCNAGHDRPFLLTHDGMVHELESQPGLVLGVLPKYQYVLQEVTLEPGDGIFLYTDGITEATNAQDEFFTVERILEALEACDERTPPEVVSFVSKAVE
ncbi:MAG TPA: GAF domain-containing SpoIIE family protein phosphatase, partial [Thermoanaerobaculia bacterium]|nr:GAF domain-containing SpoIIE family protein phosphatase [Thermoanaerobaculia bacterium]